MLDQSAIDATDYTSRLTSKLSLLCSLSALDDPAVAGARLWWGSFRRFSPARTNLIARHCGSQCLAPRSFIRQVIAVCLLSLPVSVWVVYLASRETLRRCRPSDLLTSRHHQSGRFPWRNFFHARLLVTPKPPPYLRPDNWDSTARDRMHLCNKRACMPSLDWSPCGLPSTTATLPLQPCI